jgi:hypothetical protein
MTIFGSGIYFYGVPAESAHRQFIKIPGPRTQHRVSEFAQQIILQYYNMLVSGYAVQDCQIKSNLYKQSENYETELDTTEPKGYILVEMSGKYDIRVTPELIEMMEVESKVIIVWSYDV